MARNKNLGAGGRKSVEGREVSGNPYGKGVSELEHPPVNPRFALPDELWEVIEPLLPPQQPKPKGGRPRMSDRKAMTAILYVLRTGIQWKALPRSLGAASTVHDRFQEWQRAGVFRRMWEAGLRAYDEAKGIDWSWQAMDGAMTKAPLGRKRDRPQSHRSGQAGDQA